jgi:hypothetical protein
METAIFPGWKEAIWREFKENNGLRGGVLGCAARETPKLDAEIP